MAISVREVSAILNCKNACFFTEVSLKNAYEIINITFTI